MGTHETFSIEYTGDSAYRVRDFEDFFRSHPSRQRAGDKWKDEELVNFENFRKRSVVSNGYIHLAFRYISHYFNAGPEEIVEHLFQEFPGTKRILFQKLDDTTDVLEVKLYKLKRGGLELVDEQHFGQGYDVLVRSAIDEVRRIEREYIWGRSKEREAVDYFRVTQGFEARSVSDITWGDIDAYAATGPEWDRDRGMTIKRDEEFEDYNYRGGVEDRWMPPEETDSTENSH